MTRHIGRRWCCLVAASMGACDRKSTKMRKLIGIDQFVKEMDADDALVTNP